METTKTWPLSAAATSMLIGRTTSASDALKLSIKELVLGGSLVLTQRPEETKRGLTELVWHVAPGTQPVPDREPLKAVHAALLAQHPEGGPLRTLIGAAIKRRWKLADDVRQLAMRDLESRGLQRSDKKLFRTVVTKTPLGLEWEAEQVARLAEWEAAVATGGPAARDAIAAATAAPALVLLLDDDTLQAIDAELKRTPTPVPDDGGATAAASIIALDSVHWESLEALDGLSGLDAALDSGLGGDGGGGGGGGGD